MAVTHDFAAARRETFAAFPGYFDMLQRLGMPQLNLALNQASLQGSKIGQDVSSALGSLGGGSTGVGAITRSMAAGASGQLQSQVRLNFLQQLMENALNMLAQNLQSGMGGKGPPLWEQMLTNLPGAAGSAAGSYYGSKSGGGGGGTP